MGLQGSSRGGCPWGPIQSWARLNGYSRHKLSSSSSPWGQVRRPSHTPLAGTQLLRSWHRKPVLLVGVTQAWAPEWTAGGPERQRKHPAGRDRHSWAPWPERHPELARRVVRGRLWGSVASMSKPSMAACHPCELGRMTCPLSAKWIHSTFQGARMVASLRIHLEKPQFSPSLTT